MVLYSVCRSEALSKLRDRDYRPPLKQALI
jgi:hypothetical protein